MTPSSTARRLAALWAFRIFVLAVGILGFAAIWVLLAAAMGRPLSALALVAALDAALLVRIARIAPGWPRALTAAAATAAIVVFAQFGIIAAQVGMMFGLLPWESALRLGPSLAWTIAGVSRDAVDIAWYGAALAIGATLSR